MFHLDLGLSAIRSTQVALRTVSHNITNADTPGYHRQRVELADRAPVTLGGLSLGTGVEVHQITRLRDAVVEASLLRNGSAQADAAARLSAWQRVEGLIAPGAASLTAETSRLFSALESLAARPNDPTLQRQTIAAAQGVAREVNAIVVETDRGQASLRSELTAAVDEVNRLSTEIVRLNRELQTARPQVEQPNDLLDRRDALLTRLAQLVDLPADSFRDDGQPILAAGGTLLIGQRPLQLSVVETAEGRLQIFDAGADTPMLPVAGRVAGLLAAHNDVLPQARDQVLDWFHSLRRELDQLQATGLGGDGPLETLLGSHAVRDASAPLAAAQPGFPIGSGDLFVTLTDTATGARTTHRVSIDAEVDSLADLAGRLDSLPHLAATLDPETNRLRLAGTDGYRFDFAGRPDPQPQPVAVAGTAQPAVSGAVASEANSEWSFIALDSGRVGVDEPLRVEVRNATTGALVTTLDVGRGYAAGDRLPLADGLQTAFSTGTLQAGDEWSLRVVGQPDETGALSALGLRSMFTGLGRGPFAVDAGLAANPERLSTSRTGLPADGSHAARMSLLRGAEAFADSRETFEERLASMTARIGIEVQTVQGEQDQLESLGARLADNQAAISGVDVNEEMLSLLRFQRAFQAATRFMSTVESALDDLMNLIR